MNGFKIKSSTFIAILVTVAMLLLVGLLIVTTISLRKTSNQATQNRVFTTCVSNWANATARRSSIITGLNVNRQDKLDILIRDFALAGSKDPKVQAHLKKVFFEHLHSYIGASNAYNKALKDHPLPTAPKFACANPKK